MFMEQIVKIIADYQSFNLHDVIDHDRFNQYAIVHHSSSIEGSTLTENETRLLLEEDVTPKGKPLQHSLMVKDHYDALLFVLDAANKQVTPDVEAWCLDKLKRMIRIDSRLFPAYSQ